MIMNSQTLLVAALLASAVPAHTAAPAVSKIFEAPELGISLRFPSEAKNINRAKEYIRASNYGNLDPKDGLPQDFYYVELVRQSRGLQELIQTCDGKPNLIPKLKG